MRVRSCVRISRTNSFLFSNPKTVRKFKVVIRVIISEFYMTWRKNFIKILTYRRGDVCSPCPYGIEIAYVQTGYCNFRNVSKFFYLCPPKNLLAQDEASLIIAGSIHETQNVGRSEGASAVLVPIGSD